MTSVLEIRNDISVFSWIYLTAGLMYARVDLRDVVCILFQDNVLIIPPAPTVDITQKKVWSHFHISLQRLWKTLTKIYY